MTDRLRLNEVGEEKKRPGRPPKEQAEAVEVLAADEVKEEKKVKYPPFTTKEELPEPILDKKGKFVKPGGYRYTIISSYTASGTKYKLVAMFKKPSGVGRKLVKIMSPFKKTRTGTSDKAFLNELRKSGVPGII